MSEILLFILCGLFAAILSNLSLLNKWHGSSNVGSSRRLKAQLFFPPVS